MLRFAGKITPLKQRGLPISAESGIFDLFNELLRLQFEIARKTDKFPPEPDEDLLAGLPEDAESEYT
ncbi:MAG: hypothetical protein ACOYUZ_04455 [Patescibacteria group bacterium]